MGVLCCLCPPRMINSRGRIFPRPLLGVDGKQAPNGAELREKFFRDSAFSVELRSVRSHWPDSLHGI